MPENSYLAVLNDAAIDASFSSDNESTSSIELDYLGDIGGDLRGDTEDRIYAQLTPAIDSNSVSMFGNNTELSCFPEIDLDGENKGRWECRHPEDWRCDEILNFIFYIVEKYKLDAPNVHAENFNRLSGLQLCQMTEEQFQQFEPSYGHLIHESLHKVLQNAGPIMPPTGYQEQQSQPPTLQSCRQPCMPFVTYPSIGQLIENDPESMELSPDAACIGGQTQLTSLIRYSRLQTSAESAEMKVCGRTFCYNYDSSDSFKDIPSDESGYESTDSEKKIASGDTGGTGQIPMTANACMEGLPTGQQPRNKKNGHRGRPRKNRLLSGGSSGCGSEFPISHRGRKQGQVSKNNHLWEFIRDMLKNNEHNPVHIKWEDREEGVFKFVQSVQVAKLWGKKKNNPNMTYEKLSRAMRFCRTAGYFDELPKNGRYPKKLCFKFGSKAVGWQDL